MMSHDAIREKKLQSKMIMQVHDELVFDVHLQELEEIKTLVRELMGGAVSMRVLLIVDMNSGDNWLEAH